MGHPSRLHLGCGDKKLPGWINIDSVKEFDPDILHDISNPLPFVDLSVDEILAEGVLEHFDKYVRFPIFSDWTRVLKIDGKLQILVPDFETILKKFKKFGFNNFVDFIFGENMFRSKYYIGHFGNHKFAYSEKSLRAFVEDFGIQVDRVDKKALNLILYGTKKRHVPLNEISNKAIYAHANAHGIGQATLPLSYILTQIDVFKKNLDSGHSPTSPTS